MTIYSGIFSIFDISAKGIYAQKYKMDIISQNIANADTVLTDTGEPYRRKSAVLKEVRNRDSFKNLLEGYGKTLRGAGVTVASVVETREPFKLEYNPDHPLANPDGYVRMPGIDTATEMLDMLSATRSYEANVTIFNNAKAMFNKTMEIGGR